MGIWQVVGTAWKSVRKGLKVVGFIAAIQLILNLVALPFAGDNPQASPLILLLVLAQFFLLPLIQGGCLSYANATLVQPPAPFASFTQGAGRLYSRLLGFEALTVGLVLLVALVAALLLGLSTIPAERMPQVSAVLWLLIGVLVAIGVYVLFLIVSMAPAAIVVENAGVFAALRKGLAVGRAVIGKLLLVTLVLGATLIPVMLIAMLPAFFNPGTTPLGRGLPGPVEPGWVLTAIVLQSAAGALSMVLFALAYLQLYRYQIGRTPSR